jgi:hypothetical protein
MAPLLEIVGKPDNAFVLVMMPLFAALLAVSLRAARANDRLLAEGGEEAVRSRMDGMMPEAAGSEASRVHTWPYLLRIELVASIAALILLAVLSIRVDAPLEQLADPDRTPNPSKAPWYFLGLQELLVYFDPWIAGVVLPLLIIAGLALIPYLDTNPSGNGYLCLRPRRFAISVFLAGFAGLWLSLILVGTFFRGPGWSWSWPWQAWDRARMADLPTRDWPQLFGAPRGAASSLFGGATVTAYYGSALVLWRNSRGVRLVRELGPARYCVVAFLLLTMAAVPLKMVLRLALGVKYVWATPWFNI